MCEKSVLILVGKDAGQPVPGNTSVELASTPPPLQTQVASPPPASALPSSSLPPTGSVPASQDVVSRDASPLASDHSPRLPRIPTFQHTMSADLSSLPDSPLPSPKEKGKGRALPDDGMDVDDEEVVKADEDATSSLVKALDRSVDSMILDTLADQEDMGFNVPDEVSQEVKIPSSSRLRLDHKSTSRSSSPASSLSSLPGDGTTIIIFDDNVTNTP